MAYLDQTNLWNEIMSNVEKSINSCSSKSRNLLNNSSNDFLTMAIDVRKQMIDFNKFHNHNSNHFILKKMTKFEEEFFIKDLECLLNKVANLVGSLKTKFRFNYHSPKQTERHYALIIILLTECFRNCVNKYDNLLKFFAKKTNLFRDLKENYSTNDVSITNNKEDDSKCSTPQKYQEENELLLNDLASRIDDIKNIQQQMALISNMQRVLSSTINEQEVTISSLKIQSISTNEDISVANKHLIQAIKNRATFRLWLLVILISLTLSILLIDTYS